MNVWVITVCDNEGCYLESIVHRDKPTETMLAEIAFHQFGFLESGVVAFAAGGIAVEELEVHE